MAKTVLCTVVTFDTSRDSFFTDIACDVRFVREQTQQQQKAQPTTNTPQKSNKTNTTHLVHFNNNTTTDNNKKMTVPVHFHLKNIPASEDDPFHIKFQDKVIFESKTDITSELEHVVEIEEPTHASYHRIYLNILIPMIDIDELSQYNLTEMGTHFEISTVNLKIQIKQSFTSDFSTVSDRVLIDDQKKFDVDEKYVSSNDCR